MKKYYYKVNYFFSRLDSGSFRVITNEELDTDIDKAILYLESKYLISDYYSNNIVDIESISKEEYEYLYGDDDNKEFSEIQYNRIHEVSTEANKFIYFLLNKILVTPSNYDVSLVQPIIDQAIYTLRQNGYTVYYPDPIDCDKE